MTIISPFPPSQAPALARWLNAPREPNFGDFDASDAESIARGLAAKTAAGQTFARVIEPGEAIGFLAVVPFSPVMAWFAGMVIAPEYRGQGVGTRFLELVVAALRAQGLRKLSAIFYADNAAIRATFARAGAIEEGYLAGATLRGGELADMRLWSFN